MKLTVKRLQEIQKHLTSNGYNSHLEGEDFLCIHADTTPVAAYVLETDAIEGVLHLDVAGSTPQDAATIALVCARVGRTVLGEDIFVDRNGDALFGQDAWDAYEKEVEERAAEMHADE